MDYYPFGMTVPNRSYSSPSYRYGFQGQEKDDEIKGNGNSINYKFRMHDPRVGRFLSLDPLSDAYPHNSPFAFSENRVIDGIELEGAEWLLKIYSPDLSVKFASAQQADDIYKMRVITHYARTHHFKSDFGLASIGLNRNSYAAELLYSADYNDGVSVEIHSWENSSANSGKIIPTGSFHFFNSADPLPTDANYPVDVKFGSDFYGDKDFIGIGSIGIEADYGNGEGLTFGQGYLRGFGYFKYTTRSTGLSIGIGAGVDVEGKNNGSFHRKPNWDSRFNFPTLENFAGTGHLYSLDIDLKFVSFGIGEWNSKSNEWSGTVYTGGGGLGLGIYESQKTTTRITFPKMGKTKIDYEQWFKNAKDGVNFDNGCSKCKANKL